MAKYRLAKKYLKLIVPILIVAAAILVPKVDHSSKVETLGVSTKKPASSNLQVSQSGQELYTNVAADSLQSASAPDRSATSSGLSPQQAAPNYCAPGEIPIIDGCVTQ